MLGFAREKGFECHSPLLHLAECSQRRLVGYGCSLSLLPVVQVGPHPVSLSQTWQGSIVVGIDYDCREKTIYWTDVAGRTISRASLEPGAEPETIINSGVLPSPVTSAQSHISRSMPVCAHHGSGAVLL